MRTSLASVTSSARRYAAALVVAASLTLAGPLGPAEAAAPSTIREQASASAVGASAVAEQALVDRLAVEYSGAVDAERMRTLVAVVVRDLREADSPREHLLRTAEAVCRRALTDYLARGVLLPT